MRVRHVLFVALGTRTLLLACDTSVTRFSLAPDPPGSPRARTPIVFIDKRPRTNLDAEKSQPIRLDSPCSLPFSCSLLIVIGPTLLNELFVGRENASLRWRLESHITPSSRKTGCSDKWSRPIDSLQLSRGARNRQVTHRRSAFAGTDSPLSGQVARSSTTANSP